MRVCPLLDFLSATEYRPAGCVSAYLRMKNSTRDVKKNKEAKKWLHICFVRRYTSPGADDTVEVSPLFHQGHAAIVTLLFLECVSLQHFGTQYFGGGN
jgi:hypothetical protein